MPAPASRGRPSRKGYPLTATIPQRPHEAGIDVQPDDRAAATAMDGWPAQYAASRDPELRERIILAYLGLADRLAGDDRDICLGDLVAAPGPREEPEDLLVLTGLVADLPTLERQVIVLRFFYDLDQDAIAAKVGYSQMHVSRLLRRALARMRAQLLET